MIEFFGKPYLKAGNLQTYRGIWEICCQAFLAKQDATSTKLTVEGVPAPEKYIGIYYDVLMKQNNSKEKRKIHYILLICAKHTLQKCKAG